MMKRQRLLQWRKSEKSGEIPEEDQFHSGRRRRRGASVAAGNDWSLHLTEEELLERRSSKKKKKKGKTRGKKIQVPEDILILPVFFISQIW